MNARKNPLAKYILLVAICAIIGLGAIAAAKTTMWKWVDDKGVAHYTDELYKVPAKYQSKAVKVEVKEVEPLNNPDAPPPSGPSDAEQEQAAQEAQLKATWVAKAQNAVAEVKRLEMAAQSQDAQCNKLRREWEKLPVIANKEALAKCVQQLDQYKSDLAKAIEYKEKGIYKEAQGAGIPIIWFDYILNQK